MKALVKILIVLTLVCAVEAGAVDKVKIDTSRLKEEPASGEPRVSAQQDYQDFIDNNNNGLDDRIEERRRQTPRVDPKHEEEPAPAQAETPAEKYQPGSVKFKEPAEQDSAVKETKPQTETPQSK